MSQASTKYGDAVPDPASASPSKHLQQQEINPSTTPITNTYDMPDRYANLNELGASSPVENPDENSCYRADFLENTRTQEREYEHEIELDHGCCQSGAGNSRMAVGAEGEEDSTNDVLEPPSPKSDQASKVITTIYILSYLTIFSILGTLARLGIEALTTYPGNPLTTSSAWANFMGSLIMGFLSEERQLFKNHEVSNPSKTRVEKPKIQDNNDDTIIGIESDGMVAAKTHMTVKKSIPLYIGLATGFCGSITSFSAFIRDVFLALSNAAPMTSENGTTSAIPRNPGYNFMALTGIIILTICLCLSALQLGAHVAIVLENWTPTLSQRFTRKILDPSAVVLAGLMWIGTVTMAIWPPDRPSGPSAGANTSWAQETWRGKVIFALVFAPLGTIARFYTSIHLNGVITSFPLGTFVVNAVGSVILGMAWDLQHIPLGNAIGTARGSLVGCQVLQGVQDGFCGCLTTVSTWVLELTSLKRKHAYVYGMVSISVALAFLVVIMGTMQWTRGFHQPACSL